MGAKSAKIGTVVIIQIYSVYHPKKLSFFLPAALRPRLACVRDFNYCIKIFEILKYLDI